MGVSLGDLYLALRADSSGLKSDLDSAERQTSGWAGGFSARIGDAMRGAFERVGHIATDALLNAGRAAVGYVKDSVDAASDLSESINKVSVVFTTNKAKILDWSKSSATALGQSRQQALEAAGTFGNLFDALGLTEDKSTDMSIGLVQLASDLASFNNISPDEALIKLRAGIVGETEPLRTLGVNLSAAAVEAYGLANGLVDSSGEMSEQAKVAARYAIIMEQTKNAQGDFAATSDGLANSQRILKAQWTDLSATVGTAVIPVIAQAVTILKDLATAVMPSVATFLEQNVTPAFERAAAGIKDLAANSAFKWEPEIKQLKLGDFFEFVKSDTLTYINLGEYVSFVYNKTSGAVDIKIGDLFSLSSGESGTQINLADYLTFIYDNASGAVALTVGDLITFVSDEGGTVFNLANFVSFSYDTDAGRVVINVADLVEITNDEGGTEFNLADYIEVIYRPGERVKVKVSEIIEIDNTEEESSFKLDLASLLAFAFPVTAKTLFDLTAPPEVAPTGLQAFFSWMSADDSKTTQDDLFDLSTAPEKSTPAKLADFFDWLTGSEDQVVKLTFGDFFDFSIDTAAKTGRFKLGDLFDFVSEDGAVKYDLFGGLFTYDPSSITKVKTSDLIDTTEPVALKFNPPEWLADLLAFKFPALSESTSATLSAIAAFAWPDVPTVIDTLVAWAWPDLPKGVGDLLVWTWPEFGDLLMSAIRSIVDFVWPDLVKPQWITDLLNFKIPTPEWVTRLLNWTPSLPDWLGGGGSGTSSDGSIGPDGARAGSVGASSLGRAGMGNTVVIQNLIINNAQDEEEVVYRVASRLAYGVG